MLETVPLLDVEQFRQGDDDNRTAFANSLGMALTTVGFVRLRGHGISGGLLSACYEQAAMFFARPEADKRKLVSPQKDCQRGYTAIATEHAKDEPRFDLKEFLMVGRRVYGDNIWPEDAPEMARPFMELFYQLERVGSTVLSAVEHYFALEENSLAGLVENGNSSMRIIHYPPIDAALAAKYPGSVRSARHEDINLCTVMPASTKPGLQILRRDGTWIEVPAQIGELIVNAGDMLAEITNGAVASTTHRVVNPEGEAASDSRYSMPCFVHARKDALLAVPPQFRGDGWPTPRPARTAGEALAERLAEINNVSNQ